MRSQMQPPRRVPAPLEGQPSDELSSPSSTLLSALGSPTLDSALLQARAYHVSPTPSSQGGSQRQSLKMLCTSGGRILPTLEGGAALRYGGGQTRLVSMPSDCCTYEGLLDVLRGKQLSGSGAAAAAAEAPPVIRYQLPLQPEVAVDVADSDDVALMLEEYSEAQAQGRGAGRPHLYVEWQPSRGMSSSWSSAGGRASPAPRLGGRLEDSLTSGDEGGPHMWREKHPGTASPRPPHRAKLQIIPPEAVELLSIQGTGTFGDTFRGKWHDSDVAIKCWSRGVMGMQGNEDAAAWRQFAASANQLAALRHPNLVQLYGVILPGCGPDPERGPEGLAAAQSAGRPEGAGTVMPEPAAPEQPAEQPAVAGPPAAVPPAPPWQAAPSTPSTTAGPSGAGGGAPGEQQGLGEGEGGGGGPGGGEPQRPLPPPQLPEDYSAEPLDQHGSPTRPGASGIPLHTPALVLEYVPGLSLANLLERGGRELSPAACLVNARDVAKAMEYLHSKGITHLDLKSGNVLLGWQGLSEHMQPKPIAKVTAWGMLPFKLAACYCPGMVLRRGWWPWMAPEIFRDPARVSEKADVYSFAIIMWELWAQQRPYEGEGRPFVELLISSFGPAKARPALPGSCEGVPARPEPAPGWRALMERCWAEDPAQRPSFEEILRELAGMGRELRERGRRRRQRQAAAAAAQAGQGREAAAAAAKNGPAA